MTTVELALHGDPASWPGQLQAIWESAGLTVTLDSSLRQYPGSRHWHLKRGKERGVLEITIWKDRAWISIQDGRRADWITTALTSFPAAKSD